MPFIRTFLAAAFAAGLAATGQAQDSAKVPPPELSMVPFNPSNADVALSRLDDIVRDVQDKTGIPGIAVSVVWNGKTVFAKGFGVRSLDTLAPVDDKTVFLMASVSKPIGATVVAQQVAKGGISWDTPVRDHLPWFTLSDTWISDHVTIGDLYSHRSGLPDHAGDDLEDIGYDRREVLERLRFMQLDPFRISYAYTNFGMTAAAEAVAVAADTDWATLSRDVLYTPLGMTRTSSSHDDYMARDNRASAHIPGPDGYRAADLRQPDAQSPAGGVSSTASDMARWMTLILKEGGDLIPGDGLLPALSPQIISSHPARSAARAGTYGFGMNVSVRPSARVALGHSGAFALGAATNVSMIPDLGLGIAVLTNAPPVGAAEAIAQTFLDTAEFGAPTRDWLTGYQALMAPLMAPTGTLVGQSPPANPAPALALDAYTGTYASDYFGPARIEDTGNGLILRVGPDGMTSFNLTHWDGNEFVTRPFNENAPEGSISAITFDLGESGQAQSMTVEHLDHQDMGLGHFIRQP